MRHDSADLYNRIGTITIDEWFLTTPTNGHAEVIHAIFQHLAMVPIKIERGPERTLIYTGMSHCFLRVAPHIAFMQDRGRLPEYHILVTRNDVNVILSVEVRLIEGTDHLVVPNDSGDDDETTDKDGDGSGDSVPPDSGDGDGSPPDGDSGVGSESLGTAGH